MIHDRRNKALNFLSLGYVAGGARPAARYGAFLVGPALGLTVLCAQAQNSTPAVGTSTAEVATPKPGDKGMSSTATATLNTVEITANRRREPAREVPMQVNALSAEELERKGDKSMGDYLSKEPGVSFTSEGAGKAQVSMRGVTMGADTSPTIGVYIDEVPFGSSTIYGSGASLALDMGLLDLNHIELLRGPQGTLYGAGAMGGLLKYVTNEPDTEGGFSGRVGLGLSGNRGGGLSHTENATLNVPIKDDVAAFRVSAFNQKDGGYINRIGSNPESGVNGSSKQGGRASLLLTPTKDLTVRLTATGQYVKRDGTGYVDYGYVTKQPLYGDLTQSRLVDEPFNQTVQVYSAGIEYDFGWARLNSVTAYQTIRTDSAQDDSALASAANMIAGAPLFTQGGSNQWVNTKKFTQEFRLTSPSSRGLEWVAGLFYTDERSSNSQRATLTGPNATANWYSADMPSTYKEYAAYGDLTYRFTSRLSATAGLRVAHNRQDFSQELSGIAAGGSRTLASQSSDTSKTFLFALNYLLTNNSSVFGRIASGYRPGGPQPSLFNPVTGQATPSTFKPDTLVSYELGYKADFLDKRASTSVSVFDIEWKDVQLFDVINGIGVISNGGQARSRGVEFFGALAPTPQWRLSAALTYTDARLTQDVPGVQAKSGDRMPNTPTLSASANLDYYFTVASYKAFVGATATYVGPRDSGFPGGISAPDFKMPGYFKADLRAGIDFRKANVSLFVQNLFDRRGIQSVQTLKVPFGGPAQVAVIRPRTFGMQVDVPF